MTPKQQALLDRLRATGGQYLRGAEVRVCRALEAKGLATLRDDGEMIIGDQVDGERWWATASKEENVSHTREPWTLREGNMIDGADFNVLDEDSGGGHCANISEADARRIVACVNACQGLSTEALESGALESARNYARAVIECLEENEDLDEVALRLARTTLARLEARDDDETTAAKMEGK